MGPLRRDVLKSLSPQPFVGKGGQRTLHVPRDSLSFLLRLFFPRLPLKAGPTKLDFFLTILKRGGNSLLFQPPKQPPASRGSSVLPEAPRLKFLALPLRAAGRERATPRLGGLEKEKHLSSFAFPVPPFNERNSIVWIKTLPNCNVNLKIAKHQEFRKS